MDKTCSFDGCTNPMNARTWCKGHHQQWRKGRTMRPLLSRLTLDERIAERTIRTDGCWLWQGHPHPSGYGFISIDGRSRRIHQVVFERHNGTVPTGLVIDHKCRNRSCVNPDHLQAVTKKENGENLVGARAGSKSGVRNVYWDPVNSMWTVSVTHWGKPQWGGRHSTIESAEAAAISLRQRLFTNSLADMEPQLRRDGRGSD